MRVLVAGAAGFVGSNLCDRLLADGHDVTGVDDLSTGLLSSTAHSRRSRHFRFHRLELEGGGLPELMARAEPEIVVHAATSGDPGRDVAATVALVQTPARLVLVGCASGYGRVVGPVGERTGLAPVTTQGAVEVAREALVEAAGRRGLRAVVLRVATVYGRRDRTGPVARLLAGAPLTGAGTALRDLLHVDDLAEVVVRCLDGQADGRRLNVGTGVGTSDRDLASLLATALGRPDAPERVPGEVAPAPLLDVSSARRLLGWEPVVDLASGLARTLDRT